MKIIIHKLFIGFIFCCSIPVPTYAHYTLAICAMFKNESPYMKEWIEFHKLQGVEHFFLYNNNSTDNYLDVLQPYLNKGEVTLIQWPYTYEPGTTMLYIQVSAYRDCLKEFGNDVDWLAIIDLDEFLYCTKGEKLQKFLKNYEKYGGVGVNWMYFGTSGVEEIPKNKLMIEMLTRCTKVATKNKCIKSIVQPKYVQTINSTHRCRYKDDYFAVNADEKRVNGSRTEYLSYDKIRLNHYWTRTEKHFREQKIPSLQGRNWSQKDENYIRRVASYYNSVIDTEIQQFVPALRKAMNYK